MLRKDLREPKTYTSSQRVTWVAQLSVPLVISAQVMISEFIGLSPMLGSALTAQRLLGILSLLSLWALGWLSQLSVQLLLRS